MRGAAGPWAVLVAGLALAPAPAAAAAPQSVDLEKPADAARLCRALQPVERVAPGSEAAQARARAEAMGRRYRVTVSGDGLDFKAWEEDAGLALSPRAVLVGAGRSLRLWVPDADDLAVKLPRAAAQRVFQAKARGRLALRLVVEIPSGESGEAPCMKAGATGIWILAVEPVAWEYLAGSEVLARGGEAAETPIGSATEGARVRVEVGEAVGDVATPEVRSALRASQADLEACYREALSRTPRLDGTLVVEVALGGKAGPPRSARIAADSAQDEALAACVQGVAARTRFPAVRAGVASMAVQFELAADGGR
jgi:hypothetical protein